MLPLTALMAALLETGGIAPLELLTAPPLPCEGQSFRIVCRTETGEPGEEVAFALTAPDGSTVGAWSRPLEARDGALEASLELRVPRNGLYRARIELGGRVREEIVPVLSPKREVNLIYYGLDARLLREEYLRWVTLVTACDEATARELRRRGAVALEWNWGGNLLGEKRKQRGPEGPPVTPEEAYDLGRSIYVEGAPACVAKGFDGFGLDEFGECPGSGTYEATLAFVRGMIDARPELPEDFRLVAWHAGAIGPELTGLHKRAADFLLLESYLLDIVPRALGTELSAKDLEGRLGDARSADMFTAPYGDPCRVLPTVEVMDGIPLGQYEEFLRMVRTEFPEVRGIGFFNVLTEPHWEDYRTLDRLCFDYYIRPVVTLQPGALVHDRLESGKVIASVSNIGAIDSGPVTLRLLVDGVEVDRATLDSVPAGYSRMDNRASASFAWSPPSRATYRLRAEIVDVADATVLEPAIEVSRYCTPR